MSTKLNLPMPTQKQGLNMSVAAPVKIIVGSYTNQGIVGILNGGAVTPASRMKTNVASASNTSNALTMVTKPKPLYLWEKSNNNGVKTNGTAGNSAVKMDNKTVKEAFDKVYKSMVAAQKVSSPKLLSGNNLSSVSLKDLSIKLKVPIAQAGGLLQSVPVSLSQQQKPATDSSGVTLFGKLAQNGADVKHKVGGLAVVKTEPSSPISDQIVDGIPDRGSVLKNSVVKPGDNPTELISATSLTNGTNIQVKTEPVNETTPSTGDSELLRRLCSNTGGNRLSAEIDLGTIFDSVQTTEVTAPETEVKSEFSDSSELEEEEEENEECMEGESEGENWESERGGKIEKTTEVKKTLQNGSRMKKTY